MLHGSLFGRAEGKRTINVHANLLSERLEERRKVARRVNARLALVSVSVLLAVCFLPGLISLRQASLASVQLAQMELSKLRTQFQALDGPHSAATPRIQQHEIVAKLKAQSDRFMGQLLLVLNSVPRTVACSSVKAEVSSGVMSLSVMADAENFNAAQEFSTLAAKGPGVQSALLLSTKRSDALRTDDGVAFNFVKKVSVQR